MEEGKVSIDKLDKNGGRTGVGRGVRMMKAYNNHVCQWLAQLHPNPHGE